MGLVNSVSLKNGVFNFIHEHERHDEKDMWLKKEITWKAIEGYKRKQLVTWGDKQMREEDKKTIDIIVRDKARRIQGSILD